MKKTPIYSLVFLFLCSTFINFLDNNKENNKSKNLIDSNNVTFLATADIHAGYSDSDSKKTIDHMRNRLTPSLNGGRVVAGDLCGNVRYLSNINDYYSLSYDMNFLAGFGNHDIDDKYNQQKYLIPIVKGDAIQAVYIKYWAEGRSVPVYSWEWSGIHFVQVSVAPIDYDITPEQNNDPGPALTELKEDLSTVDPSTPVVLIYHYSYPSSNSDWNLNWWNWDQVNNFKNSILEKYNVILMVTGHDHNSPKISTVVNLSDGRDIIDYQPGTALFGYYSKITINKIDKQINFIGYDENDNVYYNDTTYW